MAYLHLYEVYFTEGENVKQVCRYGFFGGAGVVCSLAVVIFLAFSVVVASLCWWVISVGNFLESLPVVAIIHKHVYSKLNFFLHLLL